MKEWNRPRTTRMYLQPPKSERLYTLWRDGRIMFGEIESPINKEYSDISASGIAFINADFMSADFKESRFEICEEGIPVHKLICTYGGLRAEIECFCDFSRKCTSHIRVKLTSATGGPVSQKFGFILRSGKEEQLINGAPDLYCIYETKLGNWFDVESSWKRENKLWRDGELFLHCDRAEDFEFDDERGVAFCAVELCGNDSQSFTFAFGKGEYDCSDYDSEKEKTVASWQIELSRINKLPRNIMCDGEKLRTVKNLTVQLLQCFCYAVGECDLYSRQGGLQRRVWTYEAMPVLEALSKIGDFDDYVEPVIDVYFNKFYTESGEIVPLGIHWAMASATVLESFGAYSLCRDKAYFDKYRNKAFCIFKWISALRRQTSYTGLGSAEYEKTVSCGTRIIEGLFPPMASCDDPLVFQAWHTTDGINIRGIKRFLQACRRYCDPDTQTVADECNSYVEALTTAFEAVEAGALDADELEIPHSLGDNNAEVTSAFEFAVPLGFVVDTLSLTPKQYEKIINYYTRRGFMRGGLLNKMPNNACPGAPEAFLDEDGNSPIWYVCAQEYYWFERFKKSGDFERCREIVEDSIRFAMTDEYYMIERYNQNNEWYAPWSPNASCNGRLINMIVDYYG